MRHTAARVALAVLLPAVVTLGALTATSSGSGCAHVNSPTGFLRCMANEKDEAVMWVAIQRLLDGDGYVAALDALVSVAPDVVKCLLQKEAAKQGAGPVENERARRAREYLQTHGMTMRYGGEAPRLAHNQEIAGSSPAGATPDVPERGLCPSGCAPEVFKKGGGDSSAARVGASPNEGPTDDSPSATTGADEPVVFSQYVESSASLSFHWMLPFEDWTSTIRVTVTNGKTWPCEKGTHDVVVPPLAFVPGKVCVTDDFTFDVEHRARPQPPAWVDRRTLLEI